MNGPSFLACFTSLFALWVATAYANTEKAIFLAPPAINIPEIQPGFRDLNLHALSPQHPSQRLALPVAFPSTEQPRGLESWYLLQGLNEGQRYELRICWAAIVRRM
jgi:hypothetical protein